MLVFALEENPILQGIEISGIGGVTTAQDAIEFLALGASTVQVCTGAMLLGHGMVQGLIDGLHEFMDSKGYETVRDIVGKALPYFTTHHDLVERQQTAKREKAGATNRDLEWGDNIAEQTDKLTTN